MEITTHAHSFRKPSPLPKGITKSTIENCWLLFELWRNGDTTFKDPLTRLLSSLITKSNILPRSTKTQSTTGKMVPILIRIWRQTCSHPGTQNGPIQCTFSSPPILYQTTSVWKSGPVRFFGQISTDRNRNRLPIMARPQITRPDRK